MRKTSVLAGVRGNGRFEENYNSHGHPLKLRILYTFQMSIQKYIIFLYICLNSLLLRGILYFHNVFLVFARFSLYLLGILCFFEVFFVFVKSSRWRGAGEGGREAPHPSN